MYIYYSNHLKGSEISHERLCAFALLQTPLYQLHPWSGHQEEGGRETAFSPCGVQPTKVVLIIKMDTTFNSQPYYRLVYYVTLALRPILNVASEKGGGLSMRLDRTN